MNILLVDDEVAMLNILSKLYTGMNLVLKNYIKPKMLTRQNRYSSLNI